MIKTYQGYALPSSLRVAYSLEYRCPKCDSESVDLDTSIRRPTFCDGGPSTGDELSAWKCDTCGTCGSGTQFVARRLDVDDSR